MAPRTILAALCCGLVGLAAWLRSAGQAEVAPRWTEVVPGVFRCPGAPAGYALIADGQALLIDGPQPADGLPGIRGVDRVLFTHYHRASCAALSSFLKNKVPVAAPKQAEEWLSVAKVRKYWQESLPLRTSRTAYLVVPEGFEGLDYSLADGQTIAWHDWTLQIFDVPGHARAQVAILAQKRQGLRILFCGGAIAAAGKIWAPYTTDWDHWTDLGLKPAGQSLRKLAELNVDLLCPAHGPVIAKHAAAALNQTAAAVEEVAFLKSFERYTKQRLGNAPQYRFLAKEQAESNGSKPWSRVSEHLWITGNTYVLVSKDNACLMFDPWDRRSFEQWTKLQKDQQFGALEVVLFSHAHYDHYDGVYWLPKRESFQVWALDQVALPLKEPFLLRAPFLDPRPIQFDRTPRDGDTLAWREYRLTFRHLPGQSEFTMGVETTIDGKRCYFTADNFFHQDMFSGSGGWMGLNRSFPPLYAASAQKVLDAAPEWVLAEHGGPFEFSAEDFRRRVQWGKVSAQAADALCLSGQHLHDWNPHHIHVEPLVQKAKSGQTLKWTLVAENRLSRKQAWKVTLEGRGLMPDRSWQVEAPAGQTVRRDFSLSVPESLSSGRHIWTLRCDVGEELDPSDAFLGIDLE
jgi:glyoxylase-like metal-dependent hydrolase (beta-lactamase superfamily II)